MPKAKPKSKLTDAERHKRFVEVAREIDVNEQPEAFERAFKRVVSSKVIRKTAKQDDS